MYYIQLNKQRHPTPDDLHAIAIDLEHDKIESAFPVEWKLHTLDDDIEDLKYEHDQLKDEVSDQESMIDDLRDKITDLEEDINDLRTERDKLKDRIAELEASTL